MTSKKFCFLNAQRPCDLTCKAAFEVDDPVDNIDCYFIWLAHHFGESVFSLRNLLETMGGAGGLQFPGVGGGGGPGGSQGPPPGSKPGSGPKGPKGFPTN